METFFCTKISKSHTHNCHTKFSNVIRASFENMHSSKNSMMDYKSKPPDSKHEINFNHQLKDRRQQTNLIFHRSRLNKNIHIYIDFKSKPPDQTPGYIVNLHKQSQQQITISSQLENYFRHKSFDFKHKPPDTSKLHCQCIIIFQCERHILMEHNNQSV